MQQHVGLAIGFISQQICFPQTILTKIKSQKAASIAKALERVPRDSSRLQDASQSQASSARAPRLSRTGTALLDLAETQGCIFAASCNVKNFEELV
jgi:hypothetical protein